MKLKLSLKPQNRYSYRDHRAHVVDPVPSILACSPFTFILTTFLLFAQLTMVAFLSLATSPFRSYCFRVSLLQTIFYYQNGWIVRKNTKWLPDSPFWVLWALVMTKLWRFGTTKVADLDIISYSRSGPQKDRVLESNTALTDGQRCWKGCGCQWGPC